jgi:hypothetical protein
MSEQEIDHRALGVRYFNAAWDLIDLESRTPEQSRDLLGLTLASRQHWGEFSGVTDQHRATSDWQVAYAASLGGFADLALSFARAAVDRADAADVPVWLKASVHEGMARAHAVSGDREGYEREAATCRELLAQVDDEEDRAPIQAQLDSIPVPG